jgi:hypothetical protein
MASDHVAPIDIDPRLFNAAITQFWAKVSSDHSGSWRSK